MRASQIRWSVRLVYPHRPCANNVQQVWTCSVAESEVLTWEANNLRIRGYTCIPLQIHLRECSLPYHIPLTKQGLHPFHQWAMDLSLKEQTTPKFPDSQCHALQCHLP